MNDPYGRDSTDGRYILNFLKGYHHQQGDIKAIDGAPPREGYKYVEAIDPKDGQRYRHTASMRIVGKKDASAPAIKAELARNPNFDLNNRAFVLDSAPAIGPLPRYGVTYDDISTHEEREHWIAGSSLRVIDLQTSEIIAERIGYMLDWAQGSRAGNREPWLLAADNACPDFHWPAPFNKPTRHGANLQAGQTLIFTERTLRPSK